MEVCFDGSRKASARRSGAASVLACVGLLALSSCSVNEVMRPQVDIGMQTAALPIAPSAAALTPPAPLPTPPAPVSSTPAPAATAASLPAPVEPVASAAAPAMSSAAVSPASAPISTQAPAQVPAPGVPTLSAADATLVQTAAMIPSPAAMPTPAPAPEQTPQPAPAPAPAQNPQPPARGMQVLVPSNPMMVSYPRPTMPQEPGITMPQEEVACRQRLKRLGVTYQDLAPINDGGSCKIAWPVKVSRLSGGIAMSPPATLNCQMAETFARWTRNELAPAARTRYLTGIGKINQGSSYSCRRIAGTSVASEHSKGNALDVMSVQLKNGREVDVRKPGFFAFRQRGLLNTVRAEGCEYFTTVLGPGYNYDHRDHFHFDLKGRRSGYRACR